MTNKIKKINLNHSFIFFFVVNLFCILLFKFNLNISSILCLLLILIIGVSHGSLDHVKGKKLLRVFNAEPKTAINFLSNKSDLSEDWKIILKMPKWKFLKELI